MFNQFQIKTRVMLLGVTAALSLGTLSSAVDPAYAGNFAQNHPRRAEVLGRDNRLNNQINNDQGHLNGQYGRLKSEDSCNSFARAIRGQGERWLHNTRRASAAQSGRKRSSAPNRSR